MEDRGGPGDPVLVLHGGLDNSDTLLRALEPALGPGYRLVAFDRRGHGRTADTAEPFSYSSMVDETVAVLTEVVGGPAHLVGWSDGGIVALLLAIARPDLVSSMVVITANYDVDGLVDVDTGEAGDSPALRMIADTYAALSPDGADHFGVVLEKSMALFAGEPHITTEELGAIRAPTLVMAADDDIVRFDHTWSLYEALPEAQMAMVPGASHAVVHEKPAVVGRLVAEFLAAPGPPETFMPIRRRARA